jgi:hypothetical protein
LRVFKNAWFARFARSHEIADDTLCEAIIRAENGQVDADLGGGVLKQRIARPGQGKSKGYRIIILFRAGQSAFFIYGFGKNERDNINRQEETQFKKMAGHVLGLSEPQLNQLIANGQLEEVACYDKKVSK